MKRLADRPYFFDAGVRFECQRCGVCCTGEPGIVYVDPKTARRIAAYLNSSVAELATSYLDPFLNSYRIREAPDGRCLFYEDHCRIYPVRPAQCRTWPFWFENIRSPKQWRRIARECPGIGCGRLYSRDEILEIVSSTMPPGA